MESLNLIYLAKRGPNSLRVVAKELCNVDYQLKRYMNSEPARVILSIICNLKPRSGRPPTSSTDDIRHVCLL